MKVVSYAVGQQILAKGDCIIQKTPTM